jgi:hypothetical protein
MDNDSKSKETRYFFSSEKNNLSLFTIVWIQYKNFLDLQSQKLPFFKVQENRKGWQSLSFLEQFSVLSVSDSTIGKRRGKPIIRIREINTQYNESKIPVTGKSRLRLAILLSCLT